MKNDRAITGIDSSTILKESICIYKGFKIIEHEHSGGRYTYSAIKDNVVYVVFYSRTPALNEVKQIIDSNYERIAR